MPHEVITPDILLNAYASGIFPMAEDRLDPSLFWLDPEERGIIPLDIFTVSRSMRKIVRKDKFTVTIDQAFPKVMEACSAPYDDRPSTWISERIQSLYTDLHRCGFAHSIECWNDGNLVGGLYGVRLMGAFFGESMFHTERDASKVALVHLVALLRRGNFTLLDTQFVTDHLKQFGAVQVERADYKGRLAEALENAEAEFPEKGYSVSGEDALQLSTQTS
ncbi:leucyl/phenylalanyl-tRNA--protein transferase [Kordiimonas sediminis]|uniref:Leucyl/phenylalanyl-tRNA--protein transferase n=1 Tax=Kordiimonas sediminis TaxID=1735581 RepID=A0A919AX61_9PROT|nr:leucyl/phenylalanyl-tRNA--protein transferase [Kordiimonas sediminis]GHF27379.1 leucyl/phenylalanyl-tRNA--protein transferase [Kordiimonas sediminis]